MMATEATREVWRWRSLDGLGHDLRYAARTLRRSPGFAATSILVLALGVGLNTAIFTVFDQIAFRPLPIKDGDRIVGVYETFQDRYERSLHGKPHMLSYPEFVHYQSHNRVFTNVAAYAELRGLTLAGVQSEAVFGLLVTQDYFKVLGADTALGRTFLSDELSSPHAVAVLSHAYWQRRFGGDPGIIGKNIRLNQTPFTIVGVAAPGFVGTTATLPELWLPLPIQPLVMAGLPGQPQDFLKAENLSWLNAIGKLMPGVTARQAQDDLRFLASQMDTRYPGRVTKVSVVPSTFLSDPDARPGVLIGGGLMMAAVGLVLFVACANIANLLLARATVRQREIAIRLSIGATRGRLLRQLLTESTLLALLGGGLGLLLAQWLLEVGRAYVGVQHVDLSPDLTVLSYTLLLSIGASLMFGLIPALQATALNLSDALRGSIVGQRIHTSRLRRRLISIQVAICCVLLTGAGLLVRGLVNLNRVDPGFQVKNVFLTSIDLRLQNYDDARASSFYRELLTRIDSEAGVHSALAAVAPLRGVRRTGVELEGQAKTDALRQTNLNVVSSGYFDVLGIRISEGRTFSDAEASRGDPVAIVSDAMAKAYWKSQSALGRRFLYGTQGRMRGAEVIGVVSNVRSIHISGPDGPSFYLPARANLAPIVVTRSAMSRPLAQRIQQIVHQLDPTLLASVRTMEDNLERETWPTRVGAGLALLMGGLALLLASVGIYGVTAYVVSQRTHEIGVRMALGAGTSNILRWILSEAIRPVSVGVAVGLPLAAVGSVASSRLLLGVHPLDPLAFLGVTVFVGFVAVLASYLPARRASRVDPLIALRYE